MESTGNLGYWVAQSRGVSLSEDELEAAESELNGRFPPDYREFLRHYNGAQLKRPSVLLARAADGSPHWVEGISLYGIRSTADGNCILDLQSNWSLALPEGCIIIGGPEGSSGIVMYIRGTRYGQIWIKSSDCDPDNRESGMFYCAPSFTAMIDALQAADPADDAKYIE
jgi:hypothetical protein